MVDGNKLNSFLEFTYLGSTMKSDGCIDDGIQGRMAKASASFGRLRNRLWNNHYVSMRVKGKTYRAIVLSTLLCGAEAWTVYKLRLVLTSLLTGGNWSDVQGVCQLHALQEDQHIILSSWTSSTANVRLSGKLAAVIHVAVFVQDCLTRHSVIVLAKPCASILSPNMMRMKLDMIMGMKMIVRRKRRAKENGE